MELVYKNQKFHISNYIVCELGASSSHNYDPTLKNCLFGALTLTINADIDWDKFPSYGTGFDRKSSFLNGALGQNVIIFRVDMSSSAHIDNKKKDILMIAIYYYLKTDKSIVLKFHMNDFC